MSSYIINGTCISGTCKVLEAAEYFPANTIVLFFITPAIIVAALVYLFYRYKNFKGNQDGRRNKWSKT